jgi:hypothetical protein
MTPMFLLKGMSSFIRVEVSISSLDMLSFQSLIWVWAIVKSNSVPKTILMVFLLVFLVWGHHHPLRSDQYFCLVPTTYESIFLEHRNELVVEPIDDILIFSMFEEIYIGHSAIVLETCRTIFVPSRSMCSRCWKWLSLFGSRAIVARCRREFKKNFLISSGIISNCTCMCGYSWDDRLLPPSSWKFPICKTSHWLIYSRTRKSPRPSLSSFTFSQRGLGCASLQ